MPSVHDEPLPDPLLDESHPDSLLNEPLPNSLLDESLPDSLVGKSMVGLLGDYEPIGSIVGKSMVGLLGDYEPIGSIVGKSMVGLLGDYSQSMGLVADSLYQKMDIFGQIARQAQWQTGLINASWVDSIHDLHQSMGSIVGKSMVGLLGDYSQSIESIADSLQLFSSSFNFGDILGTYSSSLNAYVSSTASLVLPSFQRFGERVRHWILAAFERAGLCLAPSMSEDLMYQIAGWSLKGDLRPVTLLVWNYYSRNNHARLRNVVYGWRDTPEFCARWRFYEEAFKAHVQGLYSSSIRGLIPEVEGIAGRFVYTNGIKMSPNRSGLDLKKTGSVVDRMLNVAADIVNLDIQATDMEHWIRVKSLKQYLENVFYEKIDFEQNFDEVRNRRKLSRHGSSHGIQIGSIMAMNSLRLFLLLDTVHCILQAYIAKGGLI